MWIQRICSPCLTAELAEDSFRVWRWLVKVIPRWWRQGSLLITSMMTSESMIKRSLWCLLWTTRMVLRCLRTIVMRRIIRIICSLFLMCVIWEVLKSSIIKSGSVVVIILKLWILLRWSARNISRRWDPWISKSQRRGEESWWIWRIMPQECMMMRSWRSLQSWITSLRSLNTIIDSRSWRSSSSSRDNSKYSHISSFQFWIYFCILFWIDFLLDLPFHFLKWYHFHILKYFIIFIS